VLEPMAEIGPLPGGGLQPEFRADPLRRLVDFINRGGDPRQSGLFAGLHEATGVHHDAIEPECLGPLDFNDQRVHGFTEQAHVLVGDWFGVPLVVVLGEELHGVHAERRGGLDGLVVTASDRHVGAEEGHTILIWRTERCFSVVTLSS
jgi:hypothetical protein